MHSPDPGPGIAAELAELGREVRWLARVAGRLVPDPALAEDACQDTWLKAHQVSGGRVPSRSDLFKGLRGFASVARRGERRRLDRERRAARDERLPSAAEIAARDEQIERMWKAVAELQEPLRSTLVMHYRHELPTAEIAERMDLAQDTVRWRLRKGVAELRSRLDRDEAGGGLAALAVLVSKESLPVAAKVAGSAALTAASFSVHKVLLGVVATVAATCLLWLGLGEPYALEPAPGLSVERSGVGPVEPLSNTASIAEAGSVESVAADPVRESLGRVLSEIETTGPEAWKLRAVDASGQPVPSAEVHFAERDGTRQRLGETNASGYFSIGALHGRPYSLWTVKAGYQNGFVDFRNRKEASRDLGELVMLPANALYARVVDEFGRGIPGAAIFSERPTELAGQWELQPGRENWRVTGEDGYLSWTNLSSTTRRFWIHSNRHCDRIVSWDGASEGTRPASAVVWSMVEGRVLRGRVEGLPEQGVAEGAKKRTLEVAAHLMPGDFGPADYLGGPHLDFFGRCPWSEVQDDGSFTLHGLHPGANYRLGLRERSPQESTFSESLGVMDAQSLCEPKDVVAEAGTVVLYWRRSASITFRIAVRGGGALPANLRATSRNHALATALRGHGPLVPDATGRCTITTLPSGPQPLSLAVAPAGFLPAVLDFGPLEPGDEVDLGVLELRPVPRVRVLVTDAALGTPVERASVYTVGEASRAARSQRPAAALTDRAGLANVEYFEASSHALFIRHSEYADQALSGLDLVAGESIEVELSQGSRAVVFAVHKEGGQRICCRPVPREETMDSTLRPLSESAVARVEFKETDATGRAEFNHLVAGEYEFLLVKPEMTRAEKSRLRSPVQLPGAVRTMVKDGASVTVKLGDAKSVVLEGTLTMDGEPLAGATVSLFDPLRHGGQRLRTLQRRQLIPNVLSTSDGHYRVEHSEVGDFVLVVQSDRCVIAQRQPVVLDQSVQRLDLDLTRSVIRGRVVDAGGAPVAGQVVLVYIPRDELDPLRSAYSEQRARTGADGRYRLAGLPAGVPLSVQSHGRGWQGASAGPIQLEEGEIRESADLVTDRSADLTITVGRAPVAQDSFDVRLRLIEAFSQRTQGLQKFNTERRAVRIRSGSRLATAQDLTPGRYAVQWKEGSKVVASEDVDVLLDVDNRIFLTE